MPTYLPNLQAQLVVAAKRRYPTVASKPRRAALNRPLALGLAGAMLTAGAAGAVVVSQRSAAPELVERLAVLREPKTMDDELGAAGERLKQLQQRKLQAAEASGSPSTLRELNFDDSRRVRSNVAASKVWMVPSNNDGSACLVVLTEPAEIAQTGPCLDVADKDAGSPAQTSTFAGRTEVFGIVPDGVRNVKLTLHDGSTEEIVVVDNAYVAQARKPTKSISFQGPRGALIKPASSG